MQPKKSQNSQQEEQEQTATKKPLLKKMFAGGGWALFTMFVWELVEEGLENLIAYVISGATALFIAKALSTLGIIFATQGIKLAIKRFLFPFILSFTRKDGHDKTNFIKKIFKRRKLKNENS